MIYAVCVFLPGRFRIEKREIFTNLLSEASKISKMVATFSFCGRHFALLA